MSCVFLGRYDGRMMEGVIAIPKDWAEILLGCPWVGVGIHPSDGCLVIGTNKDEELLSQVSVDPSGRITLPVKTLLAAHICDEVVMVGAVRCICVWSRERFVADERSVEELGALIDKSMT